MSDIFKDFELIWVVLAPLILVGLFVYDQGKRRRLLDFLLSRKLVSALIVGRSFERRLWKMILRATALLLIACAIMRPQWGSQKVELQRQGIDLAFVVDTSKSMLAEDVQPSRIDRVKQELGYFVDNVLQDDRISLVAFAGTARTLCPMTLDRSAFAIFLDELAIGLIPQGGTDLGRALEAALDSFGDDVRNHKAIMVFSDGEAHGGIPKAVVEEANKLGVRVYTVGVGRDEGVRIPLFDEAGSRVYLKDGEGNVVTTRLEDRILKTVAQQSNEGAYVNLTQGRNNLEKIYLDNVKKIEERELRASKEERKIDRFQWFLAAALILLMLDALIPLGVKRGAEAKPNTTRRVAA